MKRLFIILASLVTAVAVLAVNASALTQYTVVKGDSLWKIAVKNEVGLSEIKEVNPRISNPDLIYPGQINNIPEKDMAVQSFKMDVIRLTNEERVKNGLKELTYDWELSRVARYKSQDMSTNNYFSHTSPTYGSPFQMIKNFGISYKSAGENIARGYISAEAVVKGWMNSPGHRANILNKTFTHIGVGYTADGKYWTQLFISK